jgi:hypothetical protein
LKNEREDSEITITFEPIGKFFNKIHQGADIVEAALGVIIFNPISLVTMVNGSLMCVS